MMKMSKIKNKKECENQKQKNKKDEEMENKKGENIVVKLEPMVKMEVENESSLASVIKD